MIHSPEITNYLNNVDPLKKEAFTQLFTTIHTNLPTGFETFFAYKMIGFVVPLSTYPLGYHCAPGTPLPFISIAAQKNFIAIYHMGIYASPTLLNWFVTEYANLNIGKLDMGKSCIRFKKTNQIPYQLIAELAQKMTAQNWVEQYQKAFIKEPK